MILLLAFALALPGAESSEKKPNVIVILADDLGYGDVGAFGCKDIPTPAIDSLAKEGMAFRQNYAYCVCSPTRAALATGRYAERSGINTVLMGHSFPAFGKAHTLAESLKDAGYHTGLVGKWHLGYNGDVLPTRMGFDEFFGHLGGKIDYYKHTDETQKGKHDLWEGEKEVFKEGYSTDLFAERALKFIDDNAKRPFFLQVAFNAPHYSVHKGDFQAPEAWLKKFEKLGLGKGKRGSYAAMVACMDAGIGQILKKLEEHKLDKNTIVIFASDNGGEACASNGPLSGGKHSEKEGGIRVPLIVRWPARVKRGGECEDPTHVFDIMPTLLEVAKAKADAAQPLDGRSLLPLLDGKVKSLPERALCFPKATIRIGPWKLDDGKLYNLEKDLAEKNDLASQEPEIFAKLEAELKKWQESVGRGGKNKEGKKKGKGKDGKAEGAQNPGAA
jgi:arylsulfatase A-like enzyme